MTELELRGILSRALCRDEALTIFLNLVFHRHPACVHSLRVYVRSWNDLPVVCIWVLAVSLDDVLNGS